MSATQPSSRARRLVSLRRTPAWPPISLQRGTALLRFFTAMVLLFAVAACGTASLSEEQYLQRAVDEEAAGNLPAAVIELKNALQRNPYNAEARLKLGMLNLQLGDVVGARAELERAAKLHPDAKIVRLALARVWLAEDLPDRVLEDLDPGAFDALGSDTEALALTLRGDALAMLGRSAEALESFAAAMDRVPNLVDAQLGVAAVYISDGRTLDARQVLDAVLRVNPTNDRAWGLLGDLEHRAGRLSEAESAYGNAIRNGSFPFTFLMQRALIRFVRGDLAAMEDDLAALRRLRAGALGTRFIEGLMHYGRGDYHRAQTAFEKSLLGAPGFPPSILFLGATHVAQNHWALAEEYLRTFLRQYPESEAAARMLVMVRSREGTIVDGGWLLVHAPGMGGGDPQSLEAVARAQIETGQNDRALATLRKLANQVAADAEAVHRVGSLFEQAGGYEEARGQYRRAVELSRDYVPAVLSLAVLDMREGSHDRAVPVLTDTLGQSPDADNVRLALAEALVFLEDFAGAIREYETLLARQPEHAIVLNNLAFLYQVEGDPRALELAERAYALRPQEPAIADTLGWVLLNLGDVERALPLLEFAYRSLPDQPEVRYHYAAALAKAGQPDSARSELEALLDTGPFDQRNAAQRLLESLP
jgi:cellulose synthase operon protein C